MALPKVGEQFHADVHSRERYLRLFAYVEPTGWAASVFDMDTRQWLRREIWANDAEDAKGRAEEYVRNTLDVSGSVGWISGPSPIF